MKRFNKILLLLGGVLLLGIVWYVTRDTTVDFGGTVEKIIQNDQVITYVLSNFDGQHKVTVYADNKTEYVLYPDERISADGIWIGDHISGDYRMFGKYAKRVKVIKQARWTPEYNTHVAWDGKEYQIAEGVLYGKGKDDRCQLGEDPTAYYKEWKKVKNVHDQNIVHIELCSGTVLYMTSDGAVYAWGSSEGIFTDQAYSATDERSYISTPQLLMNDCQYASIGINFALFLKKDGTVWFLGESKNGQSTKITDRVDVPEQIADKVVCIKAFGYTSLWIDEQGILYLCGDNSYGQIGNGVKGNGFPTMRQDIVTQPYMALKDCYSISVENHTVTAKTRTGDLYVWGEGQQPQPKRK